MESQRAYFYILTNKRNSVLYSGSTKDLITRIKTHRRASRKGFTQKYNVRELIYYEIFDKIDKARAREFKIKGWNRRRKIELIESQNKNWQDLYDTLLRDPSALRASG